MRLAAVVFVTVVSSLTLLGCVDEQPVAAPRPAPAARVQPRPAPPPVPTPPPSRDSVRIGPGGVDIETKDPGREGRLEINFPKR